jgi:putative oxidoreductase
MEKLLTPIARILIAHIFLLSGLGKIGNYAGTQAYMEAMGAPGMLLPLVILLEVVGGLALIIGWQTRWAAFALAGFSIVAAVMFHADFADQMQMIMFTKNVAIAGGLLLLAAHGAGYFSLDSYFARSKNQVSGHISPTA